MYIGLKIMIWLINFILAMHIIATILSAIGNFLAGLRGEQ